jgi:hypothetical protein
MVGQQCQLLHHSSKHLRRGWLQGSECVGMCAYRRQHMVVHLRALPLRHGGSCTNSCSVYAGGMAGYIVWWIRAHRSFQRSTADVRKQPVVSSADGFCVFMCLCDRSCVYAINPVVQCL